MKTEVELYYYGYERRYQVVYAAGVTRWGHAPDDAVLRATLEHWVDTHQLKGKRVLEFACGEGACGVILAELGCVYHGVDIAPSAVEKAREALAGFPAAEVSRMDMVLERVEGEFDGALDCMGFHMLVTDEDRRRYLANAYQALKQGAPMLFFRQSYRRDAYEGSVASFEEWKRISGSDYDTPQVRRVFNDGQDVCVQIPLVLGRAGTAEGYRHELMAAGFSVDMFMEMDDNVQCPESASIWACKNEVTG